VDLGRGFLHFEPIEHGRLAPGTDAGSPEYVASHIQLLHEFFIEHAAAVLDLPKDEVRKVTMIYGPNLFSVVERKGDSALVAVNGIVGGDSFGNGHFTSGGGAMTGMIGHAGRVLAYWQSRSKGMSTLDAINQLACGIKEDTEAWLEASATEFRQAIPIISGHERGKQIAGDRGIIVDSRKRGMDAAMRARHALIPLNPSNWQRLHIRRGITRCVLLPPLHPKHPATRVLMNRT
jgi:hypothetical protein